MKKKLLTVIAGLFLSSLLAQTIPANPLYEFSSMGGFTSLRNSETINTVTKSETEAVLAHDRFGFSVGAVAFSSPAVVKVEGTGLDFGTGSNKGFSTSIWVKPTTSNSNYFLFSKAKNNWTGSPDFDYGLTYNTTDGLTFISGPSSDTVNYFRSKVTPAVGEWTHLAMTLNQTGETSGTKKVYVNGVKIFEGVYNSKGVSRVGGDLIFGVGKNSTSQLTGSIDDFYLYDRTLSDSEVQDLYTVDMGFKSNPTLDLKFNGNAVDSSVFKNEVSAFGVSYVNDRFGNPESAIHMNSDLNLRLQVTNEKTLTLAISQKTITREYTVSKTSVEFGDTYIGSSKSDTFYIKAPESNTASVSVKVVFDEDRTFNCPDPSGLTGAITKNIFEVFVDGVKLNSTYEMFNFPIPEDAKGNTNLTLSPGDSSIVVVNATPSSHGGQVVPEGGHVLYDCRFEQDPKNSIGLQSDEILITNASTNIGSNTVPLSFNGVENETDITGLFHNNEEDESLNIYPNPATSTINTEKGDLQILDLTGNTVLRTVSTGLVDVSVLESGIYIVSQNEKRTKLIIE